MAKKERAIQGRAKERKRRTRCGEGGPLAATSASACTGSGRAVCVGVGVGVCGGVWGVVVVVVVVGVGGWCLGCHAVHLPPLFHTFRSALMLQVNLWKFKHAAPPP